MFILLFENRFAVVCQIYVFFHTKLHLLCIIAILDESNLPQFQSIEGVFAQLCEPVTTPLYGSYWEEVK